MAENKGMHYENIKQVGELIKEGKLDSLIESTNKFAGEIKGIKVALEEKLKAFVDAKKQAELAENQQEEVKVVITGQVINPGTYSVIKDEYLETVIQLAGGITANADSSCFNYFYMISEDITIYIAPITNESKLSINNETISEIFEVTGFSDILTIE